MASGTVRGERGTAECPSENVLLDFAGGRLSAGATGALLEHLDSCAAC